MIAKKLFIIINHLDVCGTNKHLLYLLPKLKNTKKYDIEIFPINYGGVLTEEFVKAGINVVKPPKVLKTLFHVGLASAFLLEYLRKNKPDIVHFFMPEAYIIGGLSANLLGIKHCIMSRCSLNSYQQNNQITARCEHWVHGKMKVLTANSIASKMDLMVEAPENINIELLRYGIDFEMFAKKLPKTAARKAIGVDEDSLIITSTASIAKRNGYHDLINAVFEIKDRLPERWKLLCVGKVDDKEYFEELNKLSKNNGLENNILFMGERFDVPNILAASDIFALCSSEENFPLSVVEAMATGLAIVVTSAGASTETILAGESGIMISPNSPFSIGEAIAVFAEDSTKREVMGGEAQNRAKKKFSIDICVDNYDRLYQNVLGFDE